MRSTVLAILAGVLYFVGFVGFGVWPLVFIFMAVLLFAIEGRSVRQAFGLGALCGFVAMCGGYYWVVELLTQFADLPPPLAGLGYVLLNAYQGLPWAFVALLVAYAHRRFSVSPAWTLAPAVVLSEWCFPFLFPSYVGASFYRVPHLTQIADLGGPYLVDGLIAAVNGGVYAGLHPTRRLRPALVALGLVAATVIYSEVRIRHMDEKTDGARTLKVALIQSNLGARDKTERRQEFLERHQSMSQMAIEANPDLDLVVWPESAFNRAIHRQRKNVRRDITVGIDRPVLSGAITVDYSDGERFVFNSAVLTSSVGDVVSFFDKVRLVTFGETIPLVDRFPSLKKYFPRSGTFDAGKTFQHFELDDGTLMLPMICYEDLIPSFVREMWARGGVPDVLVNLTNDSWYGDTHEPIIHLALATLRSIETRRALIRSTNTGISAIVDPVGRITQRTGQWTQETLIAEVPLIEDDSSSVYMVMGDWPGWLSVGFFLGAWGLRRRSSGRRP